MRNLILLMVIGVQFLAIAKAEESVNKIGITMIDIPSGQFLMGGCFQSEQAAFLGDSKCGKPEKNASKDETPQHSVSVKAFQLSQTEITLGQFKRFIKETGNTQIVDDFFVRYNAFGENVPVLNVTWNNAQLFIDWLNKIDGGGYRLPTEAEWEYACRAGGSHIYCGSDNINTISWYLENSAAGSNPSRNMPHPVGKKRANAFGLYDMSGNAEEWVQDCWYSNYEGAPINGSARGGCSSNGFGGMAVVKRGGSWRGIDFSLRAAARTRALTNQTDQFTGFRVARDR